jgi:hypothetical protein
MSEKKTYPQNRTILEHKDGFVIITPVDYVPNIPLSCPVCQTLMRSKDDESAWESFSCCHKCSLAWAASQKEKWKNGWRPTIEQIDDELKMRTPLSINFMLE